MWYTPIYDKLKKENDDSSGLEGRHIKCVCPRNEVAVLVVNMNFKTFLDVRACPIFGEKHSGRPSNEPSPGDEWVYYGILGGSPQKSGLVHPNYNWTNLMYPTSGVVLTCYNPFTNRDVPPITPIGGFFGQLETQNFIILFFIPRRRLFTKTMERVSKHRESLGNHKCTIQILCKSKGGLVEVLQFSLGKVIYSYNGRCKSDREQQGYR